MAVNGKAEQNATDKSNDEKKILKVLEKLD